MSILAFMYPAAWVQREGAVAWAAQLPPEPGCAEGQRHSAIVPSNGWARGSVSAVLGQIKGLLTGSVGPAPRGVATERGVADVTRQFQVVLQDERFPPLARVWIARLLAPTLQQVWADLPLFEAQGHPALVLLARLEVCLAGRAGVALPCGSLEQEIKRLVLFIEQQPGSGRTACAQAVTEFDHFLTQHRASPGTTQRVDCTQCQQDQLEALTGQYRAALDAAMSGLAVPGPISNFLINVWSEVLAKNAVRQGLQHTGTLLLKDTAFHLVHAYQCQSGSDGQLNVGMKLPLLLQRLRAGMKVLGLPDDVQEAHVQAISEALAVPFRRARQASLCEPAIQGEKELVLPDLRVDPMEPQARRLNGLEISEDDSTESWGLWDCVIKEHDLTKSLKPLQTGLDQVDHVDQSARPRVAQPALPVAPPIPIHATASEHLAVIDEHHRRVALAIRSLWGREGCVPYINKLIAAGGDGMGQSRVGFNHRVGQSLMALAEIHEWDFGATR